MPTSDDMLTVYRDLADYHERQGLDQLRDRFLVLAAASAQIAGHGDEAERLRQRLLHGNAHHLLRSFTCMAQALAAPEVQTYVEELRQEYPLHAAQDLLASVRTAASAPRPSSTRVLPPTAPVIDLDSPAESLKVFRASDEPESRVPTLPAWSDPPPRKTPLPMPKRSRLVSPAVATRPATVPVSRLGVPEPPPRARRQRSEEMEETEDFGGRWVGPVLFIVILAAALYLTGATLIAPFLP